jgi:hypothetical protein
MIAGLPRERTGGHFLDGGRSAKSQVKAENHRKSAQFLKIILDLAHVRAYL